MAATRGQVAQTQEPIHIPVHISMSEAQVENISHTVHFVPKSVQVQPKDGIRTRTKGSSKISILPSLLRKFFH